MPLVLVAPGCLKTLDASLMNKNQGTGGAAGSDGSAGSDASGGSGGQRDGGGTGGIDGSAGTGGGPDATADARPDAGFTPYDSTKHPVKNLIGGTARRLVAVDDSNVYSTTFDDPQAGLVSVPLAGGSATTVTTATLSRPQDLIAPAGSALVYYAGATATDNGVVGHFLKNPSGGNPEIQISIGGSTFGRGVGIAPGPDTYAYVSLRATAANAPLLLKFSLAAGTNSGQELLQSQKSSETGGAITVTQDCVYWISDGGVWEVKKDGSSAAPTAALENQTTDAVDVASDANNIYYTRETGEVWQRPLSGTACDGSGPAEQYIAWGYSNIGHVGVYKNTVVWGARGSGSNFTGGGIFTTDVGGYDVVQIAPATKGVDDMAVGPNEIVYSTLDGSVHEVPK